MEDLIIKAKGGDKLAFTELMLQIKDELYKIAKIRLKNDDDVFDAIQETMLSAYKSLRKLKHNEYFKTWIIKILINQCNKIYRFQKHHSEDSYEIIGNTLTSQDRNEEIINFRFICDNLSKEDGTIILLYYMERYTDKEIGKILNMKESTIKTKRNRIKHKIKNFYEDYERS